MPPTPTRRLLDLALDGELDAFVATRRARGDSWSSIAFDLFAKTEVRITPETLRVWFADDLTSAAS